MIREKLLQSNFFKFEFILDDKIIGRAFLFIIYNDLHQKPYGLLENVFVEEEYKRKRDW